jgi:hypothetical protein
MTVTKKHGFASMAQNTAKLAGSSSAFAAICLITEIGKPLVRPVRLEKVLHRGYPLPRFPPAADRLVPGDLPHGFLENANLGEGSGTDAGHQLRNRVAYARSYTVGDGEGGSEGFPAEAHRGNRRPGIRSPWQWRLRGCALDHHRPVQASRESAAANVGCSLSVFPRRTGGALAVFLTGKSSHTAVRSDLL